MRYLPFFTLLLAAPAIAEDEAMPIVVTADREPMPISAVGQSITLIDRARLEQRQSLTVLDALSGVPGVAIIRSGGHGGVGSVYIRGAESDHTVALIDGVKINDPSSPGSGFDFGQLMLGGIDRIEVLRGPASVVWGSQAIGGIVHMLTKTPGERLEANAQIEGGWRDSASLIGNLSGRAGPVAASLGAGYFRTDGISAFSEALGGQERDGFEQWGATGRVDVAVTSNLSLDLRGFYSRGTTGIDGFPPPDYSFADTDEVSRNEQFTAYAGAKLLLLDGRFSSRFGYAHTQVERLSDRPGADVPTFDGLGRNQRLEYQGTFAVSKQLGLLFGFERETSRYRSSSNGGPEGRGRARLDGIYVQARLVPVDGLNLTAGIRHDDHDRFGGRSSLAFSGSFTPNEGATVLRGSWAQGFRAPSLYNLMSDYGNESLRPETSEGFELGVTQTLRPGFDISAVWFRRDSENLIDFVSCFGSVEPVCANRPYGVYDNVRSTRSEGLEVELAMRPADWLEARASYSRLEATDRETGQKLPRRPEHMVTASVDGRLPFGLSLGAEVSVVGARFDNLSNMRRLPGYMLVDLRASQPLSRHVELFGRITNLLDERYETVGLYGQPGRAAFVGVRLRN